MKPIAVEAFYIENPGHGCDPIHVIWQPLDPT